MLARHNQVAAPSTPSPNFVGQGKLRFFNRQGKVKDNAHSDLSTPVPRCHYTALLLSTHGKVSRETWSAMRGSNHLDTTIRPVLSAWHLMKFTLPMCFFLVGAGLCRSAPSNLDFNRDVRPILAAHCFACHGPDHEERQAELRLDEPSLENRKLIGAEEPTQSVLLERLFTTDEDDLMPPPETKNPLTETQKNTLRQWVNSGASYEPHWAFQPPQAAALPHDQQSTEARHPLDTFVLEKLQEVDLSLSPKADRFTLARRMHLDLLGFPPTPEETDAYINDTTPNVDERLLDRLLASPAYGERWARRWLDLARYADTNGYEKDRPRSIWPYRDWVIDSINGDQPFDQFTIDQLAGDLRPDATLAQRIATGFHRNTMLNEEGGIDPLEYRFHSLVDRVGTTATVWLGLTMACAQCHTHKYDPLYHRDYYAMMAFFNNAEEPELTIPNIANTQVRGNLEQQIAQLEADLPNQFPSGVSFAESLRTWFHAKASEVVPWETLRPLSMTANLAKLELREDHSLFARGDQTKRDVYDLSFDGHWSGVTALRLEALPDPRLPNSGPGRAYYEGPKGDFFLSELKVELEDRAIKLTHASEDYGKLGIGGGSGGAAQAIDGNEVTGWSTSGREGEPHQAVFQTNTPLQGSGTLRIRLIFNRHYPAALGRFRVAVTRANRPSKAQPFSIEEESLFHTPYQDLSEAQQARLERLFSKHTPVLAEARAKIQELRQRLPVATTTLVFEERPADLSRVTHRHHRGEYLQPKEEVSPAVPALFPSLPASAPSNRLGFSQWLVSDRNPLAARTQVNRDWAAFFGKGLVRTTEDFGYQGASPTHPKLLDWLAVDFSQQGWSRKRLHRAIVSSAVYQQGSRLNETLLNVDPENQHLARAARFRIEGELIRDSALRVAGLLAHKIGGPSVYPPQPANITTEGAYGKLDWKVSKGEDRYRRGLYTFAKRTTPYAMFTTFDAGSGEACLARRDVTNTPLQALTALNDSALLEAAKALGKTTAASSGSSEDKAHQLFRRVLTRHPDSEELHWMLQFLSRQESMLGKTPERAHELMGETDGDPVVPAAWATLARVLLNLDETFLHH